MRLTTDFFVSALIKRVYGFGGFATVDRRGAAEAGAVFLLVRDRQGTVVLYGPAPQTSYDTAKPDERQFVRFDVSDDAILDKLEREGRFDPDIWVVEIEPGTITVEELIAVASP